MRIRRGVTLVEVLVSAVLLAIGIGGCLSALVGAARLRAGAAQREALADAAEARLSWFEARGCAGAASGIREAASGSLGGRLREEWRVEPSAGGAALFLRLRLESRGGAIGDTLSALLPCA